MSTDALWRDVFVGPLEDTKLVVEILFEEFIMIKDKNPLTNMISLLFGNFMLLIWMKTVFLKFHVGP